MGSHRDWLRGGGAVAPRRACPAGPALAAPTPTRAIAVVQGLEKPFQAGQLQVAADPFQMCQGELRLGYLWGGGVRRRAMVRRTEGDG